MKKALSVLLVILMTIGSVSMTFYTFASKTTPQASQRFLLVDAAPIAGNYKWGNTLTFNVDITNNTNSQIKDIRIKTKPSISLLFTAVYPDVITIDSLKPGEKKTISFSFQSITPSFCQKYVLIPISALLNILSPFVFQKYGYDKVVQTKVGLFKFGFGFSVINETIVDENTPIVPSDGFAVSFDLNYAGSINSIATQYVKAGEKVIEPAAPEREGFQFAGWRLNNALGEIYDFDTKVYADMILYAAWSKNGADDGSDYPDDHVDENDSFVLSSNIKEAPIDTITPVIFYVESTVTVSSFELYCQNKSTGIRLFDDGNYEESHDDIPNDGCYTGVYYVNEDEENDYYFSAKASVGDQTVTTNSCSIFVFSEITDEDSEFMDSVENGLSEVLNNVRNNNVSADKNTLIAKLKKAAEDYLTPYTESGDISHLEYSEGNYSYKWRYTSTGIETICLLYEDQSDVDIKQRDLYEDAKVVAQKAINTGDIYSKGKVVVLNTYAQGHSWSNAYDKIAQKLSDGGFTVTNVYDFTCYDFKDLQQYNSLILLDSHGNTDDGMQSGNPCICTEEEQTKEKNKKYSADIKKKRILKIELSSGDKVYWIRPEFFDFYYSDNKLNSPIVNLGCCRNYPTGNNKMVKSWKDAGASAVCGYNASVTVPYDNDMADTLVEELLKGKAISEALTTAKQTNAQQDYALGDSDWNLHAVLKLYGDENASLYHQLLNGNYDSTSTFSALGIIPGWQRYGDARTISKLAGISPVSSPKMAIISSGFGSKNDQTTSCIYQTLLVPESANSISFAYDVVSEEPMEYVGSKYDDIFQVDILTTSGEVLDTIVYESVNTSNWYAIDGINFPGGDETTYHTRWINFSSDIIQKYQDQLIVLRFSVCDAGDSIYDTAALIDSVKIS